MFQNILNSVKHKLVGNNDDPLEASKRMISRVEKIVGIRNMFGEKNKKHFTIVSVLSTLLFLGTFIYVGQFSQSVYFFQVLPDKVKSFQAMNCFSSTCVPLSKFFFMYFSSGRLSLIMDMSREGMQAIPTGTSAHAAMISVLRKASYVSWLVILNQMLIHFVYMLLPLFMTIFGNDRYLPTTPGDIYGISSKYQTPYYEISFALTCIAALFSAVNQTGYIVLFVTLLAHEIGHFYAICEAFNDIHKILHSDKKYTNEQKKQIIDFKEVQEMEVVEDKEKKMEKLLKFCVKHHQFLFGYHKKICALYKGIFGVHFLIMIIVLVTTLQTLNSWGIVNTVLTAITGIMPLIVYCFGGEMLINAGLDMSFGIYSCGWEEMKIKHAKIIMLMLCLSQHPLYYTAAGIFVMNRNTFGNVAQVVYKIYAVFN